jgi:hypothetical protein
MYDKTRLDLWKTTFINLNNKTLDLAFQNDENGYMVCNHRTKIHKISVAIFLSLFYCHFMLGSSPGWFSRYRAKNPRLTSNKTYYWPPKTANKLELICGQTDDHKYEEHFALEALSYQWFVQTNNDQIPHSSLTENSKPYHTI